MSEKREITIEELDEGYVVRLDWQYMDRPRGTFSPMDRKVIAATLDEAVGFAKDFMAEPAALALTKSK